jgi:hypothetical protein
MEQLQHNNKKKRSLKNPSSPQQVRSFEAQAIWKIFDHNFLASNRSRKKCVGIFDDILFSAG